MLISLLFAQLVFHDVAATSGVRFENVYGGVASKRYILETTGTGAAFFDYDEDGDLDLFLVNGTRFDQPEYEAPSNALFRNRGDGSFEEVTRAAGLEARGWGQGVAVADVDNDGDGDLLVTYFGPNRFYRNNGDGTFVEAAAAAGLDDAGWGTSAAFADYDRDGAVDLFVANYVDFERAATPGPGEAPNCFFMGIAVMCGPKGLEPATSILYRGRGDGSFETRSATDIGSQRFYGLGAVWGDVDNDGDPDLYVANDQTPNNLFVNDGAGGFQDVALAAGVAYNEDGRAQAGMGVDLGDFDNDGWLDIYVTNFSHDYNTLYQNTGQGYFIDQSFALGLGQASYLYLGWGTGFQDFDRDGFLDLFVTNGHVYPEVATSETDSDYAQQGLLFTNREGRAFELVPDAFPDPHVGRGAAFGDYDDDGDIDVVVTNMNEPVSLYRNDSETDASWIGLRLVGRTSARDALGARVEVSAGGLRQMREVRSGGSYLTHSDRRVFIGLGTATKVDALRVRWPSGRVETLSGEFPLNRYTVVVEAE